MKKIYIEIVHVIKENNLEKQELNQSIHLSMNHFYFNIIFLCIEKFN
jgi:hypothetical protein